MKIRYTRRALAQLDEIYRHIEAPHPELHRPSGTLSLSRARHVQPGHPRDADTAYPFLVFYAVDVAAAVLAA